MGLHYENLVEEIRHRMVAEIEADLGTPDGVYLSNYLNDVGCEQWPVLLRSAAEIGNDDTLARTLREAGCFKSHVERRKPKGGFTMAAVPYTAPSTLAESQFNMYYMRGLCTYAVEMGIPHVEVYRAKEVDNPRPESEAMIGTVLDPAVVLEALRATKGVNPPIGIPLPNSGLSIRISGQ